MTGGRRRGATRAPSSPTKPGHDQAREGLKRGKQNAKRSIHGSRDKNDRAGSGGASFRAARAPRVRPEGGRAPGGGLHGRPGADLSAESRHATVAQEGDGPAAQSGPLREVQGQGD